MSPHRHTFAAVCLGLCFAALGAACHPNDDDRKGTIGGTTPGEGEGEGEDGADGGGATGEGIFEGGCPVAGEARARLIAGADEVMWGTDVLGKPGDVLLLSEAAAFVISGVTDVRTYYHYGGIPIDAAPVSGCAQAGPEQMGELGVVVGTLDLFDFPASTLHMFRGERIEVVNDGSDGEAAVVDVVGVDDRFWLVELELVKQSYQGGVKKPLNDPYGFEMRLRYTLEPGSAVLRMGVILESQGEPAGDYLAGALLFPSDHTELTAFSTSALGAGGISLSTGVPWVGAAGEEGALAFAIESANAGRTEISGVTAFLDTTLALDPIRLEAAGDSGSTTLFLSVGATDLNSATAPLAAVNPTPIPGRTLSLTAVSGALLGPDGLGVGGADLFVQLEEAGEWRTLDRLRTAADGGFSGSLSDFGAHAWRLLPYTDDRGWGEATLTSGGALSLSIGAAGTLVTDIRDEAGEELPAEVVLYRGGAEVRRFFSTPAEPVMPLPPGDYEVSVLRGYEYEPVETTLTVPEGGEATLPVTMVHAVDTTGWMAYDGHVHSSGSPDSALYQADRVRTAAAAGLDVMVATDHEIINDLAGAVDEAELTGFVATVVGQEVTATLPEHTNAWPFVPDDSLSRGGYPHWYGLDLGEVYALERERGAEVVTLNHPRRGCNYLCLIGWDRVNGVPTLDDPTWLAFSADASLWSWDLTAMEYQNGHQDPFLDPADPESTGLLDDWIGFLNLGHRVTAIGVTDTHSASDMIGSPRTYYESPTDEPGAFDVSDMVAAVQGGRAVVSAGAFARVSANGGAAGIGDTLTDSDGTVELSVHIEAMRGIDVTHFVVLVNGDQVLDVLTDDPDGVVKYDGTVSVPVTVDSNIVVLGMGEGLFPRGFPQFDPTFVPRFTTNALFVDVGGDGVYDAPGPKDCSYDVGH